MAYDELITGGIHAKLKALKWSLRAHLVGKALAWVVVALVAGVFLTLGIDYALHMDRVQRGLISALAMAGVAYILWRFLLRPFRVPMDAEELALVLEKYYPALGDRLISTLQFALSRRARETGSEALIRKVADQAGVAVENIDPCGPVESKRTWLRMIAPAVAAGVLAIFTVFNLDVMGLWFDRNVLFAETPWPQQTYLTIEGGRRVNGRLEFKAVRGRSLPVTVKADPAHVVPPEVTFHMDFPGLGVVAENVPAVPAGGNIYVKTFDNVAEPFEFYVTGNDGRTGDCFVRVVDPPELLDVRFTIVYPAYMQRNATAIEIARGVLAVPAGSRISLGGRANKDLSSARLLLDDKEAGVLNRKRLGNSDEASGTGGLRGIEGYFDVPERPERDSMKLRFELTDTEEITNPRGATYSIRIEPDRPPSVSMNRVGVRPDVTARALIPLIIHGRDDHGIAAVEVSVAPAASAGTTTKPAERRIAVPGVPAGRQEVRAEYGLDLEPMKLKIGSVLRVQAVVSDTLPESFGGPNTSMSLVQTFKVVSAEELLIELVRRQKEIRQEFTASVVLQAKVRDRVRTVRDRLAGGRIEPGLRQWLAEAGRDQGRIAAQCATAAQQLQGVLDEMNYNRVGAAADKRRLAEKVIAPLSEICKKPMIDMGAALAGASKETEAETMRKSASVCADALDELCKRLEAILSEMTRLESRQELENRLKMIIGIGTEILEQLRRRARRKTGTIFDTTSQPEKEK